MSSQEQEEWVISIQNKLDEAEKFVARNPREKCCIYRMPRRLRDSQVSNKTYEPQTVSIGPYHIGSEQVVDMDLYKCFALNQILKLRGQSVKLYLDAIKQVEDEARACYQQDDKLKNLSSNKFVEMMVLDACFILELFRCYPNKGNNPVFYDKRIVEGIVLDMVMLENQIPLFIIERLLKLMNPQHPNLQALDLVLIFFNPEWLTGIKMSQKELDELNNSMKQENCLHVLDAFRRSILHVRIQQDTSNKHGFQWMVSLVCDKLVLVPRCVNKWITGLCHNKAPDSNEQVLHRVTELRKGGVQFRKRDTNCFLDFSFNNGVLEIPPIWMYDNMMTILLNLAAFEHCHVKISEAAIASYVAFMECLIKTPEDAAHLHKHGIILGDDAQVVDIFKTVSKDILINVHEGYYADLSKQVNAHYSRRRNRWQASLHQKYFYNPWAIISFFAAVFLLLLTATQTFYAVFAYHRPNS